MTDEWETERLDLDAYLARVGFDGDPDPSGPTLRTLHRAHVASIGFENLDVFLGRGVSVDLEAVQDKLVRRGRGGYCYEHGILFSAVLERLGYSVERLLARVMNDEQRPRPRSHMTLRVRSGGEQWLADVGFGAGLLEPLPWDGTGAAHEQGGWTYQLLDLGEGSWRLRQRQGEEWTALYDFAEERHHLSDVIVANHFTATHPSSRFVGPLIAMRKYDNEARRLIGRQLVTTRPDGSSVERTLSDAEIAAALVDDFGLTLTEDDVSELLASLEGADPESTQRGRGGLSSTTGCDPSPPARNRRPSGPGGAGEPR